jgi:lipopolysaccharide export system permease protein
MIPNLITRYVLWELTKIFLISSAGFVGLMVIIGLADEAIKKGLGPDVILELIPYVIPKALMFALPATSLFSACVVFGRLSAENELVAIESMGIPKMVLVFPTLVYAFLVSLFAVWLNDISFAWSHWGVERVVIESSDKIVYGILKKEGSFSTPQFSIEVDGIEGRKLIHPIITIKNAKQDNARIVAHAAEIESNPDNYSLSLSLTKGLIESPKASMKFDDTITHHVPLRSAEEIAKAIGNPNHLYLSQIKHAIDNQKQLMQEFKQEHGLEVLAQLITGDLVGMANEESLQRIKRENEANYRLGLLEMVPHRRWANGFSCLAFVMIGIPVAIRMKTTNFAATFGLCFLPILFIYYPLFMVGLEGAKSGSLPVYAAWFGNVVCMGLGLIMLRRRV